MRSCQQPIMDVSPPLLPLLVLLCCAIACDHVVLLCGVCVRTMCCDCGIPCMCVCVHVLVFVHILPYLPLPLPWLLGYAVHVDVVLLAVLVDNNNDGVVHVFLR